MSAQLHYQTIKKAPTRRVHNRNSLVANQHNRDIGDIVRSSRIQTKLKVGAANDPLEHEADRVAQYVIKQQSMNQNAKQNCENGSAEMSENNAQFQKGNGLSTTSARANLTSDSGQTLDEKTIALMRHTIGVDFSHVKIHQGSQAEELNQQYHARAFTLGQDIYFDKGEYQPNSKAGTQLLAHELTHVAQQAKGQPSQIQRSKRPWPFNGRVINNSPEAVTVWDDSGYSSVAAFDSSDRFDEDIDYIQDKHGNWYKIGVNTVTVDANGEVSNYSCLALRAGGPCIPGDRFVPPTGASDDSAQSV